jgi:GNAT superfamily N-acetyltransferase
VISVRQEARGQGIGRALMTSAEEWALSVGAQDMELSVFFFNENAARLYAGLGYVDLSKKMVKNL